MAYRADQCPFIGFLIHLVSAAAAVGTAAIEPVQLGTGDASESGPGWGECPQYGWCGKEIAVAFVQLDGLFIYEVEIMLADGE